jgi:hypothetical protein
MITWDKFASEDVYKSFRYQLLLWTEETGTAKENPYLDGKQIPTMGVGFNLRVEDNRNKILKEMGFDPLTTKPDEKKYIDRIISVVDTSYAKGQDSTLQAQLNQIMSDWANDTKVSTHNGKTKRSEFKLYDSANEITNVFNAIAPNYEKGVDKWITTNGLSVERFSRERAVFLSLAYNSKDENKDGIPDLLGPKLAEAIKNGNRAEAWFEIRYNSNKNAEVGVAKRRYFESELFGLYDDANNVTLDEAKQAYRMLQAHRPEITAREALFGVAFDGTRGTKLDANGRTALEAANADYNPANFFNDETIDTLEKNLDPARDKIFAWLKAEYPTTFQNFTSPTQIKSLNILLDPDVDMNHGANLDARYFKGNVEQSADNILIGEGGDDKLRGGKGNDILLGGDGNDTYYYRIGDGNDWIGDKDNKGTIIIENQIGQEIKKIAVGNFYKQGDTIWSNATGSIKFSHNSPWKIVLEDGSTIDLGDNFQDGDFGIHLLNAPSDPQITNTITGDHALISCIKTLNPIAFV